MWGCEGASCEGTFLFGAFIIPAVEVLYMFSSSIKYLYLTNIYVLYIIAMTTSDPSFGNEDIIRGQFE